MPTIAVFDSRGRKLSHDTVIDPVWWVKPDTGQVIGVIEAAIIARTRAGVDRHGDKFLELSPRYAEKKGSNVADMWNTGAMLSTMKAKANALSAWLKPTVKYGYYGASGGRGRRKRDWLGYDAGVGDRTYDEALDITDDKIDSGALDVRKLRAAARGGRTKSGDFAHMMRRKTGGVLQ